MLVTGFRMMSISCCNDSGDPYFEESYNQTRKNKIVTSANDNAKNFKHAKRNSLLAFYEKDYYAAYFSIKSNILINCHA